MSFLTLLNGSPRRTWTTLTPWEELDRFFDDVTGRPVAAEGFLPPVDLEETEKEYLLSVDLPGVKREDIQLEVIDNTLFIRGERKHEKRTKTVTERSFGRFERSLRLPKDVDAERVEAAFTDGVLTVTLQKSEAAKARLIQVK